MRTDVRRNQRIMDLTKMLLSGKKLEDVRFRAYQLASKKTADEYIEQALRNVRRAKK